MKIGRTLGLGTALALATVAPTLLVSGHTEAAALANGTVTGTVQIKRGRKLKKDHSNVIVYLEGVPGDDAEPASKEHVVAQRDKTFLPAVSAVPRGTTVSFPNDDRVFHNVFSVSRAARFDLGLYRAGSTKTVEFKRAGVVDIYCNIHPEMAAKVLVLDTNLFAITGKGGSFVIPDVPAGTHDIVGWQADGDAFRGTVTVVPGKTAEVDIELIEDRGTDAHLRKDGTPYGRYQ